jgi:hypothetical protein
MTEIPIGRFAETIGVRLSQVVRAIKISLFNGVIRDTRVDTGRLRGNWQTSNHRPELKERENRSEAEAMAEVAQTVKPDTVDYITNDLPYAAVWNERDGIIDKNVARVERNVREAVR